MMRILFSFFLIIITLNSPLFSQVQVNLSDRTAVSGSDVLPGVPDVLKEKMNRFFTNLIQTEVDTAFSILLENSRLTEKKDQLKALIKQTQLANDRHGDIRDYEAVNSEFVTESYLRLRYIALHKYAPMRGIFTYYKSPEKGWIVVNVKFDEETEYFFTDE